MGAMDTDLRQHLGKRGVDAVETGRMLGTKPTQRGLAVAKQVVMRISVHWQQPPGREQ
jgi:hypothetical protein